MSEETASKSEQQPSLDDVLDWWAIAREKRGAKLSDWQNEYPQYAKDLALFESFLHKVYH